MTAKPDLAALAREYIRALSEDDIGLNTGDAAAARALMRLRDAVLSEPAAEADSLNATLRVTVLALETEARMLRAQLAARPSDERWQELLAAERAMLAAAPLFEACHENQSRGCDPSFYDTARKTQNVLVRAAEWARSEAGQRWKKEQGK